jgi:hypothetical protein
LIRQRLGKQSWRNYREEISILELKLRRQEIRSEEIVDKTWNNKAYENVKPRGRLSNI